MLLVVLLCSICVLIGVMISDGNRKDAKHAEMLKQPVVENVGDIDGCAVKYVNRGRAIDSFYLARCGNTQTSTNNYEETEGHDTKSRHRVAVTTQ